MQRNMVIVVILFLTIAVSGYCGGEGEAAASSSRGDYLSSKGIIIPPRDIYAESYIAQIDYNYPDPTPNPVGFTVYTGNRQIGSDAKTEWIHIGLKGRKIPFEELPPLNLVFVIDTSGSMYDADKMAWVKESLGIFLDKVRAKDYVALVVYNDDAKVVFQSTLMDRDTKKREFKEIVQGLTPGGGTNMVAGMTKGYQQALANFRSDYTNRVLFLTDGLSESVGAMEMAARYKDMGINCSTVGVGVAFNTAMMIDLAKAGGGSSRFIANKEEMEKIFSSELDRMVVAAGRNLKIDLELLNGATLQSTWGYQNQLQDSKVSYTLPTLHNGDYETILAEVSLPDRKSVGSFPFAEVHLSYDTLGGTAEILGPIQISARVVNAQTPVYSVSDPTVLRSSTMLEIARSLTRIGTLYYQAQQESIKVSVSSGADPVVNPALREALAITIAAKKRVQNVRQVLDDAAFDDEIVILERYVDILGSESDLGSVRITEMKDSREITPPITQRTLNEHMSFLFDEVVLSLPVQEVTRIAVTRFSYTDDRSAPILDLLSEYAQASMTGVNNLRVIERMTIDTILKEQKLQLSGLIDTSEAIKLGKLSAAQWILTGTVIDLAESLAVFIRVIDVQSGEIVTVSQVLLKKNSEILRLL